jgi:hypothetical protein
MIKDLQRPNRNFTALLMDTTTTSGGSGGGGGGSSEIKYKYKSDTWEYKLYEKIFEKQQATIATMVTFAQKQKPTNVTILNMVMKRTKKFLKQNFGKWNYISL